MAVPWTEKQQRESEGRMPLLYVLAPEDSPYVAYQHLKFSCNKITGGMCFPGAYHGKEVGWKEGLEVTL